MANLLFLPGQRITSATGGAVKLPRESIEEGEALAQVGEVVESIGQRIFYTQLEKTRARETNEYKVRKAKFFGDYRVAALENPADVDGIFFDTFAESQEKTVLEGFTSKQAESDARADWKLSVEQMKADAQAHAVIRDQNEGDIDSRNDITELTTAPPVSYTHGSLLEVQGKVADIQGIYADGELSQYPTFQSESNNDRDMARDIKTTTEHYLLDLTRIDGTEVFDNANETLQLLSDKDELTDAQKYSSDEIEALRKKHKAWKKEADAAVELENANASEAAKKDAVQRAMKGEVGLAEEVANNPLISSTDSRILIGFIEGRPDDIAKRKAELTSADRIKAENEIYDAIEAKDKNKANGLLIKNSWMFTDSKNSSMLQDIRKQEEEGTDEILKDGIAKLDRLRGIEVRQAKDDLKDIEETEDRYLKLKSDMRTTIRENPDWTTQQKLKHIDMVTDEISADAARNWFNLLYIFGPITGTAANLLLNKKGEPEYTKTATNPQTGEKVGWNGKEWVPLK